MPVQSYGLQYTMYKAENSQMFQNQFVIQDRGGREHNKRQVESQNQQRMEQVSETEELNNEDAARIDTHTEGGGGGGANVPIRPGEESEEEMEEAGTVSTAERDLEGKGAMLDIRA